MKHAILMTVYKDIDLINKLISLYPKCFLIFIHIDKKSNISINDIVKHENVYVYKKYKVNWGGNNHSLSMLLLLREALKYNCDYYHFVTGQDLPLNPFSFDEKIKRGYSYIEYFKIPKQEWEDGGLWRYQYYCLFDVLDAKHPKHYRWIKRILHFQMKMHLKRPFRNYCQLYCGSGYCSLFIEDAIIIDREAKKMERFFQTYILFGRMYIPNYPA